MGAYNNETHYKHNRGGWWGAYNNEAHYKHNRGGWWGLISISHTTNIAEEVDEGL